MQNFPKQGSVYWFNPDPTKGSEIRKVRPGIIVSPDEMNKHLGTVLIVPLTSIVQPWPFRLTMQILGQKSSAACDQLRSVDKTRLKAYIGMIKSTDSEKLFELLQIILSRQ